MGEKTMTTNELYLIYKSRKEYLKKLYNDIMNMQFLSENNRQKLLIAIESEWGLVQQKIDDLIW